VDPDDPGSEEEHDQPEKNGEEEYIITAAVPVTNESSGLHNDLPVSKSFKFFLNVQLALILLLCFFWLYEHVW
jgi:hypothetical protein